MKQSRLKNVIGGVVKSMKRCPARQETVIVSFVEKKDIMPECVNLNADLVFKV